MAGKLVTVEGLDGAGKTTHLQYLRQALEARKVGLVVTREPGGTPLGETLRGILLDPAQHLASETETLLMFAARMEHLSKVIRPALEAGRWVLCDRFTDASFAYQGGGSGVAWEKIATLEEWVQEGLHPDLTLYFDVDPETARSRASAIKTPDRFEQERKAFHERVRAVYLRRAQESRGRVQVIDASRDIATIHADLEVIATTLCNS
jgi:dTMP kinase